ncbi:MAG: hypothetical protein E6H05_03810 [Bacillati bacterium ANGP1]|uniref:SPOR domain-containing protein n=1 Tax=Candidatus Segetimicrobium genomatis TaxID=2569760 RepID=A0A537IYK4_9BACT|nr:MAG: hypothetical protein E6H05_03810 [Terrabacteria group bacterium ANGP1]
MATWDERTFQNRIKPAPVAPAGRQIAQLLAAGLMALILAFGPYWALRATLPSSPVATALRTGALEVAPAARSSLVEASQLGQARAMASRSGRFVVAFGRFERFEPADAHARLVRSKGYIAAVVQSGTAYLVVSRQYRSLADAKFWSSIFSGIGLEAKAVARLEAHLHQELVSSL